MDTEHGYRLAIKTMPEMGAFLGSFRLSATRWAVRHWAETVMRRAVQDFDRYSAGLGPDKGDFITANYAEMSALMDKADGPIAAPYNFLFDIHFCDDVFLCLVKHGAAPLRRMFEADRRIQQWGWSETMVKPADLALAVWERRQKVWTELKGRPSLGSDLSFALIDRPMPVLGWRNLERVMPKEDWRRRELLKAFARRDGLTLANMDRRVLATLQSTIDTGFVSAIKRAHLTGKTPSARKAAPKQAEMKTAADKQGTEKRAIKKRASTGRAADAKTKTRMVDAIDHADVVVSADGRTFVAVPWVGFNSDDRVYVQVGKKDVHFLQAGVSFGLVMDVPDAARSHLLGCKSVTLVEVDGGRSERLLRAKHVAMVTDISLGEGFASALSAFRKPGQANRANEEISAWEKA